MWILVEIAHTDSPYLRSVKVDAHLKCAVTSEHIPVIGAVFSDAYWNSVLNIWYKDTSATP